MKKTLQQIPFFVFLLPLFFVLHGYMENFGFIDLWDCLVLTGEYMLATAVCCALFYWIYRDRVRTALMVTCLFSIYFFFGAVHDFLYDHSIFLHKYIISLSFVMLLSVFVMVYLKKSRGTFPKIVLFLNTLLIIYLAVDLSKTVWMALHPDPDKLSVYNLGPQDNYEKCEGCHNPDIYFLLFDEYESTLALKTSYHYDNSGLDSFLLREGFHIQTGSRGNYNRTPFCMASMLNMEYLKGFRDKAAIAIRDYGNCNILIRNNQVIRFLSSRGYEIINYSIFDLAGHPSLVHQFLLPQRTNLITERTLLFLIYRDLGWRVFYLPAPFNSLIKTLTFKGLENNNAMIGKTEEVSLRKSTVPRFVYAHFGIPHSPFYFDSLGRSRPEKQLVKEMFQPGNIGPYLGYLPYTNRKLEELISTIRERTRDSAVIILMGDHGYRENIPDSGYPRFFQNLNAVYFPDRDYRLFYDSITGVNQFRVVFDKLFGQHFPLLKDSTITLQDKN
jgi:Sulfatase